MNIKLEAMLEEVRSKSRAGARTKGILDHLQSKGSITGPDFADLYHGGDRTNYCRDALKEGIISPANHNPATGRFKFSLEDVYRYFKFGAYTHWPNADRQDGQLDELQADATLAGWPIPTHFWSLWELPPIGTRTERAEAVARWKRGERFKGGSWLEKDAATLAFGSWFFERVKTTPEVRALFDGWEEERTSGSPLALSPDHLALLEALAHYQELAEKEVGPDLGAQGFEGYEDLEGLMIKRPSIHDLIFKPGVESDDTPLAEVL